MALVDEVEGQPSKGYIDGCEDTEELLDIRADTLDVVADIGLQIEANRTLPDVDPGWTIRATHARNCWLRVARWASVRLIAIAPGSLDGEGPGEPDGGLADISQAELLKLRAQVANLAEKVRTQAMALAQMAPDQVAAKRARQAAEVEKTKRFERIFVEEARSALEPDMFWALMRNATEKVKEES